LALLTLSLVLPAASVAHLLRAVRERVEGNTRVLAENQRRVAMQAMVLDQVASAVVVTDVDGRITYWNRAAEDMYGWAADEVVGMPINDVTVPDGDQRGVDEIIASRGHRGSWGGEFSVRRRDGSTFPAMVSNVILRDAAGVPIGIAGVDTDLSHLRAAEAEARRQESLARGVLESVSFPVTVIADDGEILAVNRAWEDFAAANGGTPDGTGVGANYVEATRAAGDDADAVTTLGGIDGVVTGRLASFELEYPCHAPAEERWFRMSVTPLPGIGAVIAHWNTTIEREARAALENMVRAKDQFIAAVSHELRTPLTAVLGLAEELRDSHFPPEEIDEFHRLIADQARDLSYLVEDLLVAARLDDQSVAVLADEVRLDDAVSSVLGVMGPRASLVVKVDEPSLELTAIADDLRVRQVIRNLLTNALRHGLPPIVVTAEEHRGTVTVTAERSPGTVRLSVIDHGPGVDHRLVERLFEPYARGDLPETRAASIGLGLFTSRRLARLMGGDLTYERVDGTTVFSLTLPAVVPEGSGDLAGLASPAGWP
jgi:PAS domain S-box-containing protein